MTTEQLESNLFQLDVLAEKWFRANKSTHEPNPFIVESVELRREIHRRGARPDYVASTRS